MVTHNPLHRSGRAGFPHPALALGDDAKAAQRIFMVDANRRKPATDQPLHSIPAYEPGLAPSRQGAAPKPADLESERLQRRHVHGHPVVVEMPTHNRAQPARHFRDRNVHSSLKLDFHLAQLPLQSLAHRLPQNGKHPVTSLPSANVRKAEKVECLRFPFSTLLSVSSRKAAEFQQARLVGMQFQLELPKSLRHLDPEPYGIRLLLKSHHDVIGEPHDDHVAAGLLPTPGLDPKVEHVMQIKVGQQRRSTAALRRPPFHSYPFPILQHAGVQPFLDEPHHAPVRNPMLNELHQPFVRYRVEAHHHTLPTSSSFQIESQSFVHIMRLKDSR